MYIQICRPGEPGWEWACLGGSVLAGRLVAAVAGAALRLLPALKAAGHCVAVIGSALAGLDLASEWLLEGP